MAQAVQRDPSGDAPAFVKLVNLASARLGARALFANDDFFAEKENLVKDEVRIFIADKYTDRGKWMDGWESRRRREPGNDHCLLALGLTGVIRGVDIDTAHFLGNHPPRARLSACCIDGNPNVEELADQDWTVLLSDVELQPGSHNYFPIESAERWTHLRLDILPDGGVARLRVYGEVVPHWEEVLQRDEFDLLAVENGGLAVTCNDMFFSSQDNLIMPGRGVNMGDGWETKRRREPGHDWVILRLGRPGLAQRIVIDTAHFKGNFPDRASIEGCFAKSDDDAVASSNWQTILPESKLQADHVHEFGSVEQAGPFTHIRMNIFPDGGVSRLRIFGRAAEDAL